MKILIACERSGVVREAFRAKGHDAWSCDVEPADDGSEYHHQADAIVIGRSPYYQWDMIISRPPFTYLSNSGVRWLIGDKRHAGRMRKLVEALDFWYQIACLPAKMRCIENPIQHKYARDETGQYSQIIQPWQYGHTESKATCLWLSGLPNLVPTDNVKDEMMELPYAERNRVHHMPPGPERQRLRSQTYQGIADAMADRWG